MGFFSDIGEALFGTQTKKQGREAAAAGQSAAATVGSQAATMGAKAGKEADYYDQGAKMSTGQTAGEFMQKANVAAQEQAAQAGQAAATSGTQAALRAARSSGLNKGQAALTAGQQAGDIYSNTYQQGLESGRQQYQSMAGNIAGQGAQMAGRQQAALGTQLGAAQTQAGIGAQQQQAAAQTAQGTWGTIGTIAGAAAGLSDERSKDGIKEIKRGQEWADSLKDNIKLISIGPSEDKTITVSDENAKTDVSELTKYMDNSNPTSSGYSTGVKIGSAMKDAFAKKKEGETVSDESAKDIFSDGKSRIASMDVLAIAKKIRPVAFRYKKEIVDEGKATDGQKVGVIAQDLEKTPLAQAVKVGEDGLKRIDTTELTPALLNMVVQLAQEVSRLKEGK